MKKCPQCEFIYEDEQSLCDMDGVLLVFDSRSLPKVNALGTPAKSAATHSGRNRIIPMLAALVLATVLYLVYFVSTQQPSTRSSYAPAGVAGSAPSTPTGPSPSESSLMAPPATSTQSQPVTPKVEKPAENATTAPASGTEEAKPKVENIEEKTTPTSAAQEEKKEKGKIKAQPTSAPVKSQSSVLAHTSGESKVTSFFKKTGRLLKKPFKS